MRYNPKKHHLPIFEASGILPVDKPAGWTSFDVVNFVRSRFNIPKVGHCGTLDPAATGLLILVLNKFTSFSDKLSGDDKCYQATLRLGVETTSYDLDGEIVAEKELSGITESLVRETLAAFTGEQMQLPPMVSAVKVGGKKLYELARKGVEVEREARPVVISQIDVSRIALPDVDFTMTCSKGTYVRTLCHDIGAKLGCGGVLTALRRIRSGSFTLDKAITVDALKNMEQDALADHVNALLVGFSKGWK
ncbi:MAG: tRNA pseudouridine(55) synthase TruB [Victivallaceae bacterium]|nr:tRNA pseudouridine(55) synthase TruB [Victivallaceae bacterium]